MPLTVDKSIYEVKSRVAMMHVVQLNLRLMDGWRRAQAITHGFALDCDSTMILLAIFAIGGETLLRTGELDEFPDLGTPVDVRHLRKCNLSSIAATTGLNRETVRRKVGVLARMGVVVREPADGVTMSEGLLQRPEVRAVGIDQLAAIANAAEQLRNEGLLHQTSQSPTAFPFFFNG